MKFEFDRQHTDWLRSDEFEDVEKSTDGQWEPYEGPQGGKGWRNTQTDEVRYQENPPGETTSEVDAVAPRDLPLDLPAKFRDATALPEGSPMNWTDDGFPFGAGDTLVANRGSRYTDMVIQAVYVDDHGYPAVTAEETVLGETETTDYIYYPEKDGWVRYRRRHADPAFESFVGVLGDATPTPPSDFESHPDDKYADTEWAEAWPEPDPPVPDSLSEDAVADAEIKTRAGWADPRETYNATPRTDDQIRFQTEDGEWMRGIVTDVGYDDGRVYYAYTEAGDVRQVTVPENNVQKYVDDLPYGTGIAAADESWLPSDGEVTDTHLKAEVLRVAANTRSVGSGEMKTLIRDLMFNHDVATDHFTDTVHQMCQRHPTAANDSMSIQNNIYNLIGNVIDTELSFHSDEYDEEVRIGHANSDLRHKVIESFKDEYGEAAYDNVEDVVQGGWASYEGMFADDTAPLWRAAWDEYDNDYVPKNEADLKGASVHWKQKKHIKQFRDHVAEFYRDHFGDTVMAWRGIQSDSRADDLRDARLRAAQGEAVDLRQMTLTSWTTNPAVPQKFATDTDAVVVRQEIPVEDIWLSSDTTGSMYDSETELVIGTDPEYRRFAADEVQGADGYDAMREGRRLKDWLEGRVDRGETEVKAEVAKFDFEADSWDWLRETLGLPETDDDADVAKEWVPYHGPQGGTGWENTETDDIVYDDDKPGEQTGTGFEEMARTGYVSTPDGADLRLETADQITDLYDERDASPGASAQHMDVAYWYDKQGNETHRAFVTNYGENMERDHTGEKPTLGERAIAADAFLRNIGFGEMVPKHYYDRDDQYLAVEGVGGADVYSASNEAIEKVDREEVRYGVAAVILMGNSDMHGQNVFVEPDGTVKFVDLDKSGGDWTDEYTRQRFLDRGVKSILATARQLGVDMTRRELDEACQELAQEIDIETAMTGVHNSKVGTKPHHTFADNIRANIEAFKAGSVL